MSRREFTLPWLGVVRRSTLFLGAAFLAVLTLYLLVRPVPEIAPSRSSELKREAEISRLDSERESPAPTPTRTPSPRATPRPRTPAPAPAPSSAPAELPVPTEAPGASTEPLLPLLPSAPAATPKTPAPAPLPNP